MAPKSHPSEGNVQDTGLPPRSLLTSTIPALASLIVVILLVPGVLYAQSEPNHLYDKLQISASGAELLIGPKLKLDGDAVPGTEVSTGSGLGIGRSGFEPRFAVRWRPGKRHEIEAGYLFINRSGEKTLTKDISVRDTTFPGPQDHSTLAPMPFSPIASPSPRRRTHRVPHSSAWG
jgi:hypothetical protein